MSGTRSEIARAEAEAAMAKARLLETVARLKSRLSPAVRARETWEDVREKGETLGDDALELAYEKPRIVAAVAGAGLLLLLRKPLTRLARRIVRTLRPEPPKPSKIRRKPPAGAPIPLPDQSGDIR